MKFTGKNYGSLLAVFVTAVLLVSNFSFPQQAEAITSRNYVAKISEEAVPKLSEVASSYSEVFPGSNTGSLKNTYRFSSTLSSLDLENFFGSSLVFLQEDSTISISALTITPIKFYNDPWFTTNSADINRQWYLPKAGFTEAWKLTTGDNTVKVAVIDTGIDSSHEDLKNVNFDLGYDFISKQEIRSGTSYDNNGHGTLISGVIAATPDNGLGIVGAAQKVAIIPIVALDKSGSGLSSVVAEALVWAADNGAHIINLSISDTDSGHDVALGNAVAYAFNKGVLVVAAAGNDSVSSGLNLDEHPLFPICDDNGQNMVLGVTSSDYLDVKPSFANFGKSCIDVTAPGKRIVSTVNFDTYTNAPAPNSYAYVSGTSISVPLVVAQAALIKAYKPDATNKQIRDVIIATSDNIDEHNLNNCDGGDCKGLLGAGRISVMKSLEAELLDERLQEGNLVQVPSGVFYYMSGGKKQPVSLFVRSQRFAGLVPFPVEDKDLEKFPTGPFAAPLDGTLIKSPESPTVYYVYKGTKQPITGQVFGLWNYDFSTVKTLSAEEVNSWVTASFLTPPDGLLIKTPTNPAVYLVQNWSLHPMSFEYFINKGYSRMPITLVSDSDLPSFSLGEPLILNQ